MLTPKNSRKGQLWAKLRSGMGEAGVNLAKLELAGLKV